MPGIPGDDRRLGCLRCGRSFDADALPAADATNASSLSSAAAADPSESSRLLALDDLEFASKMQEAEALLASTAGARFVGGSGQRMHLDLPHAGPAPAPWNEPPRPAPASPSVPVDSSPPTKFLAWVCLALGVMATACGGVLLGWSWLENRPRLGTTGLPIAVAGQAALLAGLLLQLERLWRKNRQAAAELAAADRQVESLRQTASLVGGPASAPSSQFYYHLAHAAPPRVLLADLKGQLDLLAARLGRVDPAGDRNAADRAP